MSGFGTPDPPAKPAPPTHIRLSRRIFLGVGLGDGEIGQVFAIVGDHRETTATSMGRVRAAELVTTNGADYIPAPKIANDPTPPIRPPETLENTEKPASSAEEPAARVSDAESGAGDAPDSAAVGGGTGEEASGGGDPALSAADSPLVSTEQKKGKRK